MIVDRNLITSIRKGVRDVQPMWSAGCRCCGQPRVVATRFDLAAYPFHFRGFSWRRQDTVEAAAAGVYRDALGLGRRGDAQEAVYHGAQGGGQAVSLAARTGHQLSGLHQGTGPMESEAVRGDSATISPNDAATLRRHVLVGGRLGGIRRRWKSCGDAADQGQRGPLSPDQKEEAAEDGKPGRSIRANGPICCKCWGFCRKTR